MSSDCIILPEFTKTDMLNSLKPYQREVLEPLLDLNSEEDVAQIWLSSEGPSGNSKFGGVPGESKPFWDRVKSEFRKLVCGHESYADLRRSINENGKPSATFLIGMASTSIATSLGVTTALIAPAITLLLYMAAKVGINAWCAT